ncbi:cupin domain-containing protein [Aquimarina longa]|uniref:cupin domain-containing protein n=1 Tax=Aquimarina longa TaxID=1080221 RepID=UPI0007844F67|nr:cupin domain-containing protein [Aquimarina longa]
MKTASIFKDIVYKENKPNIDVLLETDFTKEIRIVFKENQIMKEHKAPFSIIVFVADGEIDFRVNKTIKNLKKGDLIALKANVPHDLKALKDSIVKLTLSKYDDKARVDNVVN